MMLTNKRLKIRSSKLRTIKSCQRGFSLLEVMIAVLILAIGLLGIAGLQVTAKRSNYEAVQRTTATMLIRDMIERMRANPTQLDTYTNTGAGRTFSPSAGITTANTVCFGSGVTCDAATIATYDLYEWENALAGVTEINTATNANVGGLALATACMIIFEPYVRPVASLVWAWPCPLKNRVGENSPTRWPTICSVT